jgi:hypothetical protein
MGICRHSRLTIVAGAAWLAFAAITVAHRASAAVPPLAVTVAAVGAIGLALAATVCTAASVWRGPPLRRFPHDQAVCCGPGEAAVVRSAAQLRGTLGGAGHVHRGRLAFSALAWLGAAGCAAAVLAEAPLGAALLLGAATAALSGLAGLLPARPFYYREAMGGWVVVYPREACERLVAAPLAREHAPRLGRPPPAPSAPALGAAEAGGWGTSLTPPPPGSNHPPPPGGTAA